MRRSPQEPYDQQDVARNRAARHGTAAWSSPEWRDDAVSWLDEQLAAAGIHRRGDVEQPHLRPWATVLRAPTSAGPVWLKAVGPGTAFEVGLYEVLARIAPDRVLTPIASDSERGWILLPDGGQPIGERLAGTDLTKALVEALAQYGDLQRNLTLHVDELLTLGVADMRPAIMSQRFDEAMEAAGAIIDSRGENAGGHATHRRVTAMRTTFATWCQQLGESRVPASLDHNDLHPWNILGDGAGTAAFYDWGDSVVAHPFAAMLVPLGFVQRLLDVNLDDPGFLSARDTYLQGFAHSAGDEDLAATLELACRVAKVARALTWNRALQAARDDGDEIDDGWVTAPLESVASLLDESYLGGA
ncbi:MAG: phosphotransferase [Streptosporangiales bacterium]|nr:phosphotransferase [Streptosporangiales bacterium]